MHIATIVGARPQFIKAVLVSKALRKKHHETLIHTGQHYGREMSQIFFDELQLPKPDYALNIGPGSPTWQVGAMLIKLEKVLMKEKPDLVMVYGDTHSTLAGALAAAKLNIPLAHVEAGLRSYHPTMQEEKNRVVTDHLSQLLFCPTKTAVKNLKKEGITTGVHLVGDVMVDSLRYFLPIARKRSNVLQNLKLSSKDYLLATIHRAETADHEGQLKKIISAFSRLGHLIVLPLHPRTAKEVKKHKLTFSKNVRVIDPVGYLDMLVLEKNAKLILTDSGGIQKEAYFLKIPCITLRDETEWPETLHAGYNTLTGVHVELIVKRTRDISTISTLNSQTPFGSGKSIERLNQIINRFCLSQGRK